MRVNCKYNLNKIFGRLGVVSAGSQYLLVNKHQLIVNREAQISDLNFKHCSDIASAMRSDEILDPLGEA